MSFLQPWMLVALPLALLPIIIHLINQRRYQTTQWAAMMFLLAANRMNRGYAKIRQWAILALRTLVVAALVFAVGRPLSSGLLGGAITGGGSSNTIVLLDRSPSMQQRDSTGEMTKLESGLASLSQTLTTMGVGRVVLIENNAVDPREVESPSGLIDLPDVGPSDAAADVPAMMLAALDYVRANELGQTEIWIASDLRENDWRSGDGRWTSLRQAYSELGRRVRFRLLAFPESAPANQSVRAREVVLNTAGPDPFVSLTIDVAGESSSAKTVPVTIEIEGSRSTADVKFDGVAGELKGHRITLPRGQDRGWGRVSIPADANAADNDYYFTFDVAPPRRTVVVTDDEDVGRVLKLAAEITPDVDIECLAEVVSPDAVAGVDWESVSLVMWQGPVGDDAKATLESMVDRGGVVIFLPVDSLPGEGASAAAAFGVAWDGWNEPDDPIAVGSWRGEADLLAATLAGASLPVGELKVNRYAGIQGECTVLATLDGGDPLLVRVPTPRGAVYALATTPNKADSSLATDGVVLYVMVQRALQDGAQSLRNADQMDAGEVDPPAAAGWRELATRGDRLSTQRVYSAGVYADDNRWLAINRPASEDQPATLSDSQVDGLFSGLLLQRVDQSAGSSNSIVEEVWRAFLIIMLVAMIGEAILCLPRPPVDATTGMPKGDAVAKGAVA